MTPEQFEQFNQNFQKLKPYLYNYNNIKQRVDYILNCIIDKSKPKRKVKYSFHNYYTGIQNLFTYNDGIPTPADHPIWNSEIEPKDWFNELVFPENHIPLATILNSEEEANRLGKIICEHYEQLKGKKPPLMKHIFRKGTILIRAYTEQDREWILKLAAENKKPPKKKVVKTPVIEKKPVEKKPVPVVKTGLRSFLKRRTTKQPGVI